MQRVAEESEGLARILRIEARPLKQAVGGSDGEASAPELDLITIKDPRISFEFHNQSILFTSADGAVSSTTSGRRT